MRHILQNIASLIGTFAIFGAPLGIIAFVAFSGGNIVAQPTEQTSLYTLSSISKVSIISLAAVFLVGAITVFLYKFSRMLQRTADRMGGEYGSENRGSSKWLGEGESDLPVVDEKELRKPKLHSAWEDFGKSQEQLDREYDERRKRRLQSLAPYVTGEKPKEQVEKEELERHLLRLRSLSPSLRKGSETQSSSEKK